MCFWDAVNCCYQQDIKKQQSVQQRPEDKRDEALLAGSASGGCRDRLWTLTLRWKYMIKEMQSILSVKPNWNMLMWQLNIDATGSPYNKSCCAKSQQTVVSRCFMLRRKDAVQFQLTAKPSNGPIMAHRPYVRHPLILSWTFCWWAEGYHWTHRKLSSQLIYVNRKGRGALVCGLGGVGV